MVVRYTLAPAAALADALDALEIAETHAPFRAAAQLRARLALGIHADVPHALEPGEALAFVARAALLGGSACLAGLGRGPVVEALVVAWTGQEECGECQRGHQADGVRAKIQGSHEPCLSLVFGGSTSPWLGT